MTGIRPQVVVGAGFGVAPVARLLWCVAHIWFLTGYRNRFIVGANWLWNCLTFARGARLITGDIAPDLPAVLVPRPALRPLNV